MRGGVLGLVLALTSGVSCATGEGPRVDTGLEGLGITAVNPTSLVRGSTIVIEGHSFLDVAWGISWLHLVGTYGGTPIDVELPATFVDFEHLEVKVTGELTNLLGGPEGVFQGSAIVEVDSTVDGERHSSAPASVTLEFQRELEPILNDLLSDGAIFVNDEIWIEGDGFLLGGEEGTTYASVEGCFIPEFEVDCLPIGPVEVPLVPDSPFDRTRGSFAFAPFIAGIQPGHFEGWVKLRNDHEAGGEIESGGFVGGAQNQLTILRVSGQYFADDDDEGTPVPELDLIPDYESGRLVRYVLSEEDQLGQAIDLREDTGTFEGTVTPLVRYEDQEYIGLDSPMTFRIEPIKQVVWVKFMPSYVESLREFGLRAVDQRIRDRIFEVLERDYATINVEFRAEQPTDFKLYSEVEIAGPDPNGLGLLGYDNTPGKDTGNERLYDRIGGVNALTQDDGYPGFGGVFIESLFVFSNDPPMGSKSEAADPLFDDIFDAVRGDRGGDAVTAEDLAGGNVPTLSSGGSCPSGGERRLEVACAIWVMGSVIGSTVSHELGHSFGLADPFGTRFHNLGDVDNRLMDKGGARPFAERGELEGMGPSRYCTQAYLYLREVMPNEEPEDTSLRPPC